MRYLTPFTKSLVLGFLLAPTILSAQPLQIERLADVRDKIVFPELSSAEKRRIATQARIFLRDLYVHRAQKQDYYDNVLDPVPAIQKIVKNAEKMSTKDLELGIYKIFAAQRDLHLNYHFPAPYNRFTSFIPMTFERTAGEDNFFEVRVSALAGELFEKYAPGQRVPAIGDEILSYNGQSVIRAVKQLLPVAQGSNIYGGFARALQTLSVRSHKRHPVLDANEVTLELKGYGTDGKAERYTITLPWLTRFMLPKRNAPSRFSTDDFQDEYLEFTRSMRMDRPSVYPGNPSAERELTWGRISNEDGNFAYLRLNSFVPVTGRYNTIGEIRRLLQNELADTDGLIFDVRNNGGGDVAFADLLPQLFTKRSAQTLAFRMLNNDTNRWIFEKAKLGGPMSPFVAALAQAKGTWRAFTKTARYTSKESANQFGQVYYKPVGLLTNAKCYSATDMFSCSLQDNGGCIVFGEDPKTGAGGANVMAHSDFMGMGLQELFQALPGDHSMRVSWRQNIKFGPNAGEIIEDNGCDADVDVSLTAADLLSGGQQQLAKITGALASLKEDYLPSANGESQAVEVYLPEGKKDYTLQVKHTPLVRVYLDGELQEEWEVGAEEEAVDVTFDWSEECRSQKLRREEFGVDQACRLTFVGVDEDGEVLWNLRRTLISPKKKVAVGPEGFKLDFAANADLSAMTIVNKEPAAAKDVWSHVAPCLQIGCLPQYVENLNTEALLFLDLKGKQKAILDFGAEYDTEMSTDFFSVVLISGNKRKTLMSVCGSQPMGRYTFDISEFAGMDNVALSFGFASDGEIVAKGVKITDIGIR